jgi:DDE superfamily endonuclease
MAWREADVDGGAGPGGNGGDDLASGRLAGFRRELYRCLGERRDALFELGDAVLCPAGPGAHAGGAVAGAGVPPRARRGVRRGQLRGGPGRAAAPGAGGAAAAGLAGRADPAGRGCSPWLRPEAATSPERMFCHVYGRGKGQAQMIPGWPYSVVAALEPGRTSWTAVLDAVRLGPEDDGTEVTAAQVRDVVTRLIEAGHWRRGDPDMLIVFDAGYHVTRLAWLLKDLPVELLGRLRSDRVMQLPVPARRPGTMGRPRQHGGELALADPATWPAPQVTTSTATSRYGTATAAAWDRVHPRLTHRAAWAGHDGPLPVIEGTLIRLQVDRLPGDRDAKPAWLWSSVTGAAPDQVDRCWQAFLRRFDLEHNIPPVQAGPGVDRPEDPRPRRRRPVDLADHRLLRPAPPGPAPRRRHPAALAAALPGQPAHTRPGPPGLPEHPRDGWLSGRCAETRQTRPRPPARLEEPPPGHPLRRG